MKFVADEWRQKNNLLSFLIFLCFFFGFDILFSCFRIFTEEPKRIPAATAAQVNQPKKTTLQAQKIVTIIEKQKKEALEQIQKKFQLTESVK